MNDDPKNKVKLYEVCDSSCTQAKPERIHDIIIDGQVKQVKFTYAQKTMLPFSEAMKFHSKEGFQVLDDKGIVLQRVPETPLEAAIKLNPDQVIANLSELSSEALYARAVGLTGGEKFRPNSSRGSIIEFLTKSVKEKTAPSAPDPTELPELAEADLDKLIAAE